MRAAFLVVLACLALAPQLRGEQALGALEFLGLATIPSGTELEETIVGGLSGITYDSQLDRYYVISDDPAHRSPSRFYTLKIDLDAGRLAADGVEVEGVTVLTDRRGRPFEWGVIDGEGIALTAGRTLLISSEGNIQKDIRPSIREVGLDGKEIHEYRIPKTWLSRTRKPHGARHNAVFEALTLLPSGRHYVTGTENALLQDGPKADLGQGGRARISRFDVKSGKLEADYVYMVDPVVAPPTTEDGFRTNGLVELVALSDSSFLALERSFSLGAGNSIRLFLISTAGADNVRQFDSLEGRNDLTTVAKRLLIDFADLDLTPDNIEGMTLGPNLADGRRSLILVSDDNFSSLQTTQILVFAVAEGETRVSAIQGASHRSPLESQWIAEVRGVVTAVDLDGRRQGFWIQDVAGDGDDRTSDGLFVSAANAGASVEVGNLVSVAGRVVEVEKRGSLPVSRIEAHRVDVLQSSVPLPDPVAIGEAGRPVPASVDDDHLETFDILEDAIDFYESLEGMRVSVDKATVVGPTTYFGTLTLAIDGGDGAHTSRGGLLLGAQDPNTERLVVDGSLVGGLPDAEVGQPLATPLVGVLDYAFANFRLIAIDEPIVGPHPHPLFREAFAVATDRLNVATYNVWNLDPGDSDERFSDLGGQLAARRPDIVALQEVQDDSGTEDDGTVTATATLGKLVEAARVHGGPSYEFLQIDPADNADGGAPGGNIRVAFLYDPQRVSLATEASRLFESSPAFLEDSATGFEATRKPLAAEFEFNGRRILAINVHLKSKRGDDGFFGSRQPPMWWTETQRIAQVREIGDYVLTRLEDDPGALVMVLGDFNEHEHRWPMKLLADYGLRNLIERTDRAERYTYIYEGNSQVIDHILASPALALRASDVEILHLNADLPHSRRTSDHDAVLASFEVGGPLE